MSRNSPAAAPISRTYRPDQNGPATARLLALLGALYPAGRPFTVDDALKHRSIAAEIDKIRMGRTAPAALSALLISHVGRRTTEGTISIATNNPLAFKVSY